jgi:hypothetical protein
MLQGAWTAHAARTLSIEFDSRGLDVLCAHQDRRIRKGESSGLRTRQIISWMGSEFRASSRLAFPDIAMVDRKSKKVVLLAEVEESEAQPKLVIADLFATLLGDRVTFGRNHKEDLIVGPWTSFIVLAKSAGSGSGEQQLRILTGRLNEILKHISTPNATVGRIGVETYRSESQLTERLRAQAENALREFR